MASWNKTEPAASSVEGLVLVGNIREFEPAPGHDKDGILMLEVDAPQNRNAMQGSLSMKPTEEPSLVQALTAGYIEPEAEKEEAKKSAWKGESVVVYRNRDGSLFCVQRICPHASASLSAGDIEDYPDIAACSKSPSAGLFVSCPAHSYIFDVDSGKCVSEPRCRSARTYAVNLAEDGGLWVDPHPRPQRDPELPVEKANEIQIRLMDKTWARA